MGYDLDGAGGYFRFNIFGWKHVLNLAKMYGWQPLGTKIQEGDEYKDWDGRYFSNSYQTVINEDARNIATALEKALPDIPRIPVHTERPEKIEFKDSPSDEEMSKVITEHFTKGDTINNNAIEYFSGEESRQCIVEFIAYCKKGGFVIG